MKYSALFLLFTSSVLCTACSDSDPAQSSTTLTIKGSSSSTATLALRQFSGAATGSPLTMKVKIYGIYASTSTDCSSPTEIFNSSTPTEFDFTAGPTLYSGAIAAGTYPCFIMRMSDNIVFTPDAAAVAAWPLACSTGTEYTHDIYRADNTNAGEEFKDLDGNTITPNGTNASAVADIVYIMASTDLSAVTARGYTSNQTVALTGALTVPGATTFFADFSNGIEDTGSHTCKIEEGTGLGFR